MITETEKESLLAILMKISKPKSLGFHPITTEKKYNYIYVKANEKNQGVWYRLEEKHGLPTEMYLDIVEEAMFKGNLVDVILAKVHTKFGDQLKIDLVFDTGDDVLTIIRSGASTFSEGVLRSFIASDAIINPISIIPQKADKSDKAIFGIVRIDGKKVIIQKDMPRLITWNPKIKPSIDEVASTFLPAVNVVREKLGLELISEAIDRQAEYELSKQSSSEKSDKTILMNDDRQLLFDMIDTQIQELGWSSTKAQSYLSSNYEGKNSRHLLKDAELADLLSLLQSKMFI